MATLGPAQHAIRVMALHMPKPQPTPTNGPTPAPPDSPAGLVLRSLLTTMGHGVTMPGQDVTMQAILEQLRRGQ